MLAGQRYSLSLLTAALVSTSWFLGCQPETPTLRTAKPTETPKSTTFELKVPSKPAKSEPDAEKKLDAMIAAHTGGKRELLQKLKSSTFIRNGQINLNGPRTAVQTIDVEWPTRYKYKSEITTDVVSVLQAGLTPGENWQFPGPPDPTKALPDKPQKQKLTSDVTATVRRQMQEDAVFLLFPFVEPETRVAIAETDTVNDKACPGLHVWTPALDYVLVHLEPATSQIVRLAYRGREGLADVSKVMVFEEVQDFGGVKLGSKIYLKAAGSELATWRQLSLVAGKTFDPVYFDNP